MSRQRKRSLQLLAVVGSVTTILSASGLLQIVSVSALIAILVWVVVPELRATRRVEPLADMGFLPRAPYRVTPATEDDIRWIAETAARVYSGADVIPINLMLEWFTTNPHGFFIIQDRGGHRCGNLDILPLRPDTLARFISGELVELEIRGDCLFRPSEAEQIRAIYIESFVAITRGFTGNALAAYKCLMSTPQIMSNLCEPSQITMVYAIGASESGIRLMTDLGFDRIASENNRRDRHKLFCVRFTQLARNIALRAESKERTRLLSMLKDVQQEPTL